MAIVNIRHGMHSIRQARGSNVCWAAAVAMVVGRSATIESIRGEARAGGVTTRGNGSLPIGNLANVRRLAGRFRLRVTDVRTAPVTLQMLLGWLRRGWFVMLGGFNFSGSMTAMDHAVTFYPAFPK